MASRKRDIMKVSYTNLETIGAMTMDEAIKYIEDRENYIKEIKSDSTFEIEFNIQVVCTTEKGLLLKESSSKYHFVFLKADK